MNLYRNMDSERIQFDFLTEYPEEYAYDAEVERRGGHVWRTTVREDHNLIRFRQEVRNLLADHPEYRVVHCHNYTVGNIILSEAERANVTTRIAHAHNNQIVCDSRYLPKQIMKRFFPIHATDLMACSREAGDFFFRNRSFTVLRNAIDVDDFKPDSVVRANVRAELGIEEATLVVGHVGRLHAQKNHKLLLEAFVCLHSLQPASTLMMVGSGPLHDEICQYIHDLNLDGAVIMLENRHDMNRLYQAMDVFCLPSMFEGLGIVAVEAQAAGLPCVISDHVSAEAILTPLVTVEPLASTPESWANAVIDAAGMPLAHADYTSDIKAKGYDVHGTARRMQEFYLERSLGA